MTGPACSRCGRPAGRARRGLCNACYTAAYRRGDFARPAPGPDARPRGKCSHPGCPDPVHARGLCRRHAWQAGRYGQVTDRPHPWSPPGEWTVRAACAADPDLMFAEDYRSVQAARAVCAGCPVRAECLACALDRGEPAGVWGGLTTEERAAVLAGGEGRRMRLDTEYQARELPGVRAIYALPPGTGRWRAAAEDLLAGALTAAGVELGAYDTRIAAWLAGWEPEVAGVVASWITRAAGKRCQRCGRPAAEGSDWCAACEDADAAGALAVLRSAADDQAGGAR